MHKPVSIERFIKAIQALPSDGRVFTQRSGIQPKGSIGLAGSEITTDLGHAVAVRKQGETRNTSTTI